ncbi:MAG: hypothetical protein HY817_03495 [Candidatus Abawacabacteria bacterium]|nr:hypothetical protein [Candidatus Abawacabacteria bacterium]
MDGPGGIDYLDWRQPLKVWLGKTFAPGQIITPPHWDFSTEQQGHFLETFIVSDNLDSTQEQTDQAEENEDETDNRAEALENRKSPGFPADAYNVIESLASHKRDAIRADIQDILHPSYRGKELDILPIEVVMEMLHRALAFRVFPPALVNSPLHREQIAETISMYAHWQTRSDMAFSCSAYSTCLDLTTILRTPQLKALYDKHLRERRESIIRAHRAALQTLKTAQN